MVRLPSSPASSTDGRTTMWPPSAPGTQPLTSSRPRSVSTRTTFRSCVVRVTLP